MRRMTTAHSFADDRRAHPRHRVLKRVKAVFNSNSSVLDCLMRDLSLGGARLTCSQAILLPDSFVLVFPAEREMRDVRVAWRKIGELGVQFMSPPRKALHLLI
jgi:hypothetical protein